MTVDKSHEDNKWHAIQKRVSVTAEQQQTIEKIVTQLKTQTPALFVLVTDRNGQVVHSSGELVQGTALAELAALLAGDLAASSEIAHLTGTYRRHPLIPRKYRAMRMVSKSGSKNPSMVYGIREKVLRQCLSIGNCAN